MILTPRENLLSDAERLAIEEQYLKTRRAACPRCGRDLQIKPGTCEGPVHGFIAICDPCNSFDKWSRAKREVRSWSKEESDRMLTSSKAFCPIEGCGALVDHFKGADRYHWAKCPGCGNHSR